MVDRIDERRQQEVAAAFFQPASLYFASKPPYVPTKDTISTTVEAVHTKRSIPVLDMPEDAGIEVVQEGLGELDDLVHGTFLNVQQTTSEYLVAKRSYYTAERSFSEAKDKERTEEFQKQVALSKKVGTWDSVEKSLVSLGLVAAGVAGISMGAVALGITAVAIGTLMIVDQLLDETVKKTVASWMARASNEEQEAWLDRINLATAATSMALSLGLAAPVAMHFGMTVAAKYAGQLALTTARASASGVKTVYEWMHNNQKALMIELDAVCTLSQKSVSRLIFELQETCRTIMELYENMHRIEQNKDKLWRQMMRLNGR